MNDFNERLSLLNKEKLRYFLSDLKKPCYESELLKVAFDDNDVLKVDSLGLYQNHFLLFNLLYKMQEEYYIENKYLHIHFMRTFLTEYPTHGLCRWYNDHTGLFCRENTSDNGYYCDFHYDKICNELEELSIKYFYFDTDNFYKLDKEKADAFISGSWELLSNYDEYKKSLTILQLNEGATLDMVKKQFKIMAKKYHPDLGEETHNKFNEINNAYRLLMRILPNFFNN